jgi:hypothetical protein
MLGDSQRFDCSILHTLANSEENQFVQIRNCVSLMME